MSGKVRRPDDCEQDVTCDISNRIVIMHIMA